MKTFVRCGQIFTGREDDARRDEILVFDEEGVLDYVGLEAGSPRRARGDRTLDYSGCFVMPGLIDVHTHLAYGNAKSEEDIDLYSPLEFRTLRGMFFAQKVAAAGFTAICSPGDAGQISLSIRNEIRRQVKDGVDCIKIALDGIQRRDNGELVAAFTQEETDIMVREIHRLGKKAVAHARGREATLYAARAGVDLIFHANHLDDECIAAMRQTGSTIAPTLTHPRNTIDFTQPHEPAFLKGRPDHAQREYEIGCANWKKARAAGVPILTGTDTGFAVTPYGEWNARELELFVDDLGFTPAAALRAATEVNARFMTEGNRIGVLERGRAADFIALDASPLADIGVLQDSSRLRAVYIAGKEMCIPDRPYDPRQVTDFALSNWTDLYTRARVAELRQQRPSLAAAE